MNSLQLFLTLEEINVILTALGKQPCDEVFGVVTSIHAQVRAQQEQQMLAAQEQARAEAPQPAKRGRKPKTVEGA